jgi:hypothetical protein
MGKSIFRNNHFFPPRLTRGLAHPGSRRAVLVAEPEAQCIRFRGVGPKRLLFSEAHPR